jgi:uncharacterized repeat protein (TIGR01451 family)
VNAVLLLVGLGLVGGGGQIAAAGGSSPPLPAPVRAPDPLPDLQAAGLPPAPETERPEGPAPLAPSIGQPSPLRNLSVPAPAVSPPQRAPTPQPARVPAFRLVKSSGGQEASSLGPDIPTPPPAPVPPAASPTAVSPPTVTVDKSGPAQVQAGEPFGYEITLRNVGPSPAARVLLEDELPPGTRVLAAQPQPHVQGTRLLWQVESLPPGGQARFRVEVQAAAAGPWQGTATVMVPAARTLQVAVRGAAAAPAPQPPLALELHGPPQTAVTGHPVAFAMRVSNRGPTVLAGVVLRAHLPPELDHRYGSDIERSLEPLRPGESRTETLEVIAEQPGRHVAEVSVLAGTAAPVTARAEVAVVDDQVLQIRLRGPREGWTDREHEYRIEVTNRSPAELRDLLLVERLPRGMALLNPAGGTYDRGTRSLSWRLDSLAPGQTRAVTLRLLTRVSGPSLNEISARTGQGHQARLQTVLRFWPQGPRGQR